MKKLLDRITGLVTMYALVLYSLIAIGLTALVLSLIDQFSGAAGSLFYYSPLALLGSAAVSLGATLGSGWLFARIARVQPHTQSALITGMLIFFILEPHLLLPAGGVDWLSLGMIALTGVIASASKYLLAVRGRHIFNPAALGVFVVSLIVFFAGFGTAGLFPSFPIWWVGTPTLLIPVALGAFFVLYRTQRLTVGVTFLVVAFASYLVNALATGGAVDGALTAALFSYPVVFFAGFMLSEPLTLPPRRWQQLLEAVVVALLMTVYFNIGNVLTSTPQLALLVGNLIGFAFGQRRGINLSFLGKKQIGPTTWELAFTPARPVRLLPGQYMELTIPHRKADFRGSRRYFSISSAPGSDGPLTFALTMPDKSSSFKRALLDLEPGAAVRGTSVGGDFALPKDTAEPLLLIAGGIGITPFASQLAAANAAGEKRDVVVVYSNSAKGDLPYGELLEKSGARVVLFGPKPSPLPMGWEYGGEGRVTPERLAELVPDTAKRRAYISGPPTLVAALRTALRGQGVRRVHSDYFSGY